MRKTLVVNLRRSHYDVYIGRAGKGQSGYFGNPVAVGRDCPICDEIHDTGEETLPCYEIYLQARLVADPEFKQRVDKLRGKTLGCFCKPKPCHGDVLASYVDSLEE